MLCTNCGAANADDAKVCISCHQPLSDVWQSPKSELVGADGGAEELVYAGFWERFAAWFLDALVLWVVAMVLSFASGVLIALGGGGSQPSIPLLITAYFAPFLIFAAYFVLMESGERGATLGKRALKLRVVDVNGNRISKLRALGRWAAHGLSNLTIVIGYVIQPFTARKQALHDMVAGTLVVKTEKSSSGLALVIAIVASFFVIIAIIGILAAIAIPQYQSYVGKAHLYKAEAVGKVATQAVESYAAQTGKIPASIAETGAQLPPLPEVDHVTVNPQDGEVQVVLSAKGMPGTIAGKALVFDAEQTKDGKIMWKCSGPGIPKGMLPLDCR
jgi:uncharacterized RDD family membrane protein YckC/Tfp pilus assembly protein PilE